MVRELNTCLPYEVLREKEFAPIKNPTGVDSVESARAQAQSGMEEVVTEIESKCKELENSFFDLQMENLQLKKELERTKSENSIEQMSIGQI